ncbi:MAG: hypothetical protein NTU62_01615 [Spirochaetes bacterium]|nr:hypothetical protein [Spirochaetota bacterium]
MKKLIMALVMSAFLFTGFAASAQTQALVLPVGKENPTVDGVSVASEYPVGTEINGMKLWLARTADAVYAAFSAPTTGWVAMGFGSPRMDGALMFIGFVSSDGKAQLKIQKGAGHSHGDVQSDALIQFAMKEEGGVTTLEVAVKSASVIGKAAAELPMIMAYGGADNFASLHRAHGSVPVKLQ